MTWIKRDLSAQHLLTVLEVSCCRDNVSITGLQAGHHPRPLLRDASAEEKNCLGTMHIDPYPAKITFILSVFSLDCTWFLARHVLPWA